MRLRLAPLGTLALLAVVASSAAGGTSRAALRSCAPQGVKALCGTLSVPEDRAKPSGSRIRLSFAVIRARDAAGREPVFVLAGGPGGSALDEARFASLVFGKDRRDVVLLDQRGVGRSAPLLCPAPRAGIDASEVRAYAKACIPRLSADPRTYGTDAFADDVDAVRAALGYRRIVVYGGSYGATAALVYVARHGSQVKSVVLDGGTSPEIPFFEEMPANAQRMLERLSRSCDADQRCEARYGHLAAEVDALVARLRAKPGSVDYQGARVPFGAAEAGLTIEAFSRDPAAIPKLFELVHAAASGSGAPLAQAYAAAVRPTVLTSLRQVMYWRIVCFEGWAHLRPTAALAAARGTYMEDETRAQLDFRAAFCPLLPRPGNEPDTGRPPRSQLPALAIVGGLDPQDPRPSIAPLANAMPNTTILDVPGGGHGSVQYGCAPAVVGRFLDRGRIDSADRACAAAVEPPSPTP